MRHQQVHRVGSGFVGRERTVRRAAALAFVAFWLASGLAGEIRLGGYVKENGTKEPIYSADVATMIDEFFEDGSRNDGTVDSNIVTIFTQCFGGDWLRVFNGTAGEDRLDPIAFSNTARASANGERQLATYGVYHGGASAALRPGVTVDSVHEAGRDDDLVPLVDNPVIQGQRFKNVGGTGGTHVLVWASDPNDLDREDIDNIVNNFPVSGTTTVTVLAGDGSVADGTAAVSGPATREALRAALANIGERMDDADDVQFVLFITDHGSLGLPNGFLEAPAADTDPGTAQTGWTVPQEVLNGIEASTAGIAPDIAPAQPGVGLIIDGLGFDPLDVAVGVQIGENPSYSLGAVGSFDPLAVPGLGLSYSLPLPGGAIDELLEAFQDGNAVEVDVILQNFGPTPARVDEVLFLSGSIPKLPDPDDIDWDRVFDLNDNCVGVFNPEQLDLDLDTVGNDCDNCPFLPNPSQANLDGDDEGDFCDPDDGELMQWFDASGALRWDRENGFGISHLYGGRLSALRQGQGYTQEQLCIPTESGVADPCVLLESGTCVALEPGDALFTLASRVPNGPYTLLSDTGTESIPDSPGPGEAQGVPVFRTIDVPQGLTVGDLNVCVDIEHDNIGDLGVWIQDPQGEFVLMWWRGCNGIPTTGLTTCFDDSGTAKFCNANGPTPDPADGNGNIAPSGSGFGTLESLGLGQDGGGTWLLTIADYFEGNAGLLLDWRVEIASPLGGETGLGEDSAGAPRFNSNPCSSGASLQQALPARLAVPAEVPSNPVLVAPLEKRQAPPRQ